MNQRIGELANQRISGSAAGVLGALLLAVILRALILESPVTMTVVTAVLRFVPGWMLLGSLQISESADQQVNTSANQRTRNPHASKFINGLERAVLAVPVSLAVDMVAAAYASFLPGGLTSWAALVMPFLVAAALGGIAGLFPPPSSVGDAESGGVRGRRDILILLVLAACAFALPLDDIMAGRYSGYDPWVTQIQVRGIQKNPLAMLAKRSPTLHTYAYGGWYYFVALLHQASGASVYALTRFDGALNLVLVAMLLYVWLRRLDLEGRTWAALAAFLYITHPIVVRRFTMPVRENAVLGVVLALLYVLSQAERLRDARRLLPLTALLFGTILASHRGGFAITLLTVSLLGGWKLLRAWPDQDDGQPDIRLLAAMVGFGFLLLWPFNLRLTEIVRYELESKPRLGFLLAFGPLLLGLALPLARLSGLQRLSKRWKVLTKHQTTVLAGIVVALTIGAFWAISHPLSPELFQGYNPPITWSTFGLLQVLFLPLGLFERWRLRWRFRYTTALYAFALAVLLLINLLNVGIPFELHRAAIYLGLPLSLLAALAWMRLFSVRWLAWIGVPLLVGISMYQGVTVEHWRPWSEDQIAAAETLLRLQEQQPGLVLPMRWDPLLLEYFDVPNVASENLTQEAFAQPTVDDLLALLQREAPENERAYFFFSRKYTSPTLKYPNEHIRDPLSEDPRVQKVNLPSAYILVLRLDGTVMHLAVDDFAGAGSSHMHGWSDLMTLGGEPARNADETGVGDGKAGWATWLMSVPDVAPDEVVTCTLKVRFWGLSDAVRVHIHRGTSKKWDVVGPLPPQGKPVWQTAELPMPVRQELDVRPETPGVQLEFGLGGGDRQFWIHSVDLECPRRMENEE